MANRNVARILRTCIFCKTEFTVSPSVKVGKYCSPLCRTKGSRKSVIKLCEQCGQPFTVRPCETRRGGKVCSVACRSESNRQPIEQRFWSKVNKTETCWLWTGASHQAGYGVFRVNRQNVSAHRFVLEIQGKVIPQGYEACHRCDNPPCVRPDHLFIGTRADNMQDCIKKRRHSAKLTPEKVIDIRKRRIEGASITSLASEYHVHIATIRHVINRQFWKHVA